MNLKYLNKQHKTHILLLSFIASEVKHIGDSLKLEGTQKRKMSTISTYAQQLFDEIIGGLDDSQRLQIIRLIRDKTIEIVPTNVFTRKEKESEEDEWVRILAQKAVEFSCIKCERVDHESCELKCALINMLVPMVNDNTNDCPYRVTYDEEGRLISDKWKEI